MERLVGRAVSGRQPISQTSDAFERPLICLTISLVKQFVSNHCNTRTDACDQSSDRWPMTHCSLLQVIMVRVFGKRSTSLSKSDLADVDVVLSQSKAKRSQMSSSLSSINGLNGLSRSALQVQNHGNLVKTSLAFHQQQSHHSLQVEQHHNHSQVQHQYYSHAESQPQMYSTQNHHIFSDHYLDHSLDHSNHSMSQINSIEYSNCPPMTFTGNGWVWRTANR